MTYYLCSLQQIPQHVDLPRSALDIERAEIMLAVRQAQQRAAAERREVRRLRRDVRRLERMSPAQRLRRLWHAFTPVHEDQPEAREPAAQGRR